MPEERIKRSVSVWIFWAFLVIVLGIAVASLPVGICYRQELVAFSHAWGDVASVVGVWIGVIGFAVTILTLFLTHQLEKDARARIEQAVVAASDAVAAARNDTREAVVRIGLQFLQSECETLGHHVHEIRRLTVELSTPRREGHWVRVAEKCRDAAYAGNLLLANPQLTREEVERLSGGVDSLRTIALFVEKRRIPPGSKHIPLAKDHLRSLEDLFTLFTNIQRRLRREVLEVPHARN